MAAVLDDILHHPASEAQRQAYNAAFDELGLNWHWDPVTFARLPAAGRGAVKAYIEREQPHLLRAYEADFLTDAIETAKDRCYRVMVQNRSARYAPAHRAA